MMPALLKRVLLADLFEGLRVTFRNQNPKYIYTEQYPAERPQISERYRGAPWLRRDPATGKTLCNGCGACALACPESLIVVGSERNSETKRKEMVSYTFDTSRCMFCGLCQEACPTDAIVLTQGFEIATYSREGQIWDRGMLEEGLTPTHYKC